MYRPGELDEKISFLREQRQDDGFGGHQNTLVSIAEDVHCKVRPLSGKESSRFDRLNAEETCLFVTRYRTDITEVDRIVWDKEEYNIRHIPRKSRRSMYSEFYAERGVAQ